MPTGPRHFIILLLVFALASLAGPPGAQGHTRLTRSEPADQARLTVAPGRVDFWFDERLDERFHSVRVVPLRHPTGHDAADLIKGSPRVDPADPSHLVVDLPPLAPGRYAIEWRVLSRDGHSAAGRISFEVQGTP